MKAICLQIEEAAMRLWKDVVVHVQDVRDLATAKKDLET